MPPYGHQIPNFDRWHIVNYVRQLQGRPRGAPAVQRPPRPRQAPARGELSMAHIHIPRDIPLRYVDRSGTAKLAGIAMSWSGWPRSCTCW